VPERRKDNRYEIDKDNLTVGCGGLVNTLAG